MTEAITIWFGIVGGLFVLNIPLGIWLGRPAQKETAPTVRLPRAA